LPWLKIILAGFRIQDLGSRGVNFGFRILDPGFRIWKSVDLQIRDSRKGRPGMGRGVMS
jgi:hypothetical protein